MGVPDIVKRSFACTMTVEAMLDAVKAVPGLDWQERESPAEGRYLRGLTTNGVKVRLVRAGARVIAEIHFPIGPGWTRFTDPEKSAFVDWTRSSVFAALGATDEREES